MSALLMLAALGTHPRLHQRELPPEQPREKTAHDLQRIEAAKAKRERKAARK